MRHPRPVGLSVGDHVDHNPYFIDFPKGVPDTLDFWTSCIASALMDPRSAANVSQQLKSGRVNLLDLPTYGRYQHTFEEMLGVHEKLLPAAKDRVTVLHLGGSLTAESHTAYLALAGSPVPLGEGDLSLLGALAELHVRDVQPEQIDVRENRGSQSCTVRSGCSHRRRYTDRRPALGVLDQRRRRHVEHPNPLPRNQTCPTTSPSRRTGRGDRGQPDEAVFAVARGEHNAKFLAGRVELAIARGEPDSAVAALKHAPGMLLRSVDRLARLGVELDVLVCAVEEAVATASTRVLLSLREHLLNRDEPVAARLFVNQAGRPWVTADQRPPLPETTTARVGAVLDAEIARRLLPIDRLVLDPACRTLAVPLSGKARTGGLGVLPRGSTQHVEPHVRFFVYWKERQKTTDFDLSLVLLNDDATEFIDVDLDAQARVERRSNDSGRQTAKRVPRPPGQPSLS